MLTNEIVFFSYEISHGSEEEMKWNEKVELKSKSANDSMKQSTWQKVQSRTKTCSNFQRVHKIIKQ